MKTDENSTIDLSKQIQPTKQWLWLAVFALLSLGIGITGYLWQQRQQQQIIDAVGRELAAVADLKVREISFWRRERLTDAEYFRHNRFIAALVDRYFKSDRDAKLGREIAERLSSLLANPGYSTVFVLDPQGGAGLQLGDTTQMIGAIARAEIAEAVASQNVLLGDIHLGLHNDKPHINLIAPLLVPEEGDTEAVGILLVRIDPALIFYPLIQTWPTYSPTAEVVLFRQEGDSVMFLNDLRHRPKSALRLKWVIKDTSLPAAQAIRGERGLLEGVDYAYARALAVSREVPETNWFLLAKVSWEEISAPVRARAWQTFLIAVLMVAATAVGLLHQLRRQQAGYLKEKLEASENLQATQERFKITLDSMMEGGQIIGYDWRYLYINEVAARQGQSTPEELLGCTMMEAYPGIENTPMFAELRRVMTERQPHSMENEFTQPDGSKGWFELAVHPVPDGIFVLSMDTTDRKRAEQQRLELDQQRRLALDAAQLGWWHYDPLTRVAKYDDRYKEIFEVTGYEKPNDEILKRLHPDDLPNVWAEVEKALDPVNPIPYASEYRIIMPDASVRWIEAHGIASFVGSGEQRHAVSLVGTVQDITERRHQNISLQNLSDELARKNAELEQIVYVASHDLRSPLLNIQGFSKELRHTMEEVVKAASESDVPQKLQEKISGVMREDVADALRYIETSIRKMDTLLNGLLKLSRLGRAALEIKPLSMNQLIGEVIESLQTQIKECGAVVEVGDLPVCSGDAVQINQVFSNLLANAIQYRDPDRVCSINITGRREGSRAVYKVADNGIGIAPEHQAHVFEIFHRLDPDHSPGEGLGLTIVQRILERHNGKINLESNSGVGSSFRVELPISKTVQPDKSRDDSRIALNGDRRLPRGDKT